MTITIFTSNQPRHIALAGALARLAGSVFVVQESNTVFPGRVADFFKKSEVMQDYFAKVIAAERAVFGEPRFLPAGVRSMSLKMGDLSLLPLEALAEALSSDYFIVFGASFIKGALCDHLVSKKAINIHMGTSPYYRGSSCNFWAMYDGRPEYVGATVHLLTKGLDSGPMLFHALPRPADVDGFELGMRAVKVAHEAVTARIADGTLLRLPAIEQDKSRQLRYTRNEHFTEAVAAEYLQRTMPAAEIRTRLEQRDLSVFLQPFLA